MKRLHIRWYRLAQLILCCASFHSCVAISKPESNKQQKPGPHDTAARDIFARDTRDTVGAQEAFVAEQYNRPTDSRTETQPQHNQTKPITSPIDTTSALNFDTTTEQSVSKKDSKRLNDIDFMKSSWMQLAKIPTLHDQYKFIEQLVATIINQFNSATSFIFSPQETTEIVDNAAAHLPTDRSFASFANWMNTFIKQPIEKLLRQKQATRKESALQEWSSQAQEIIKDSGFAHDTDAATIVEQYALLPDQARPKNIVATLEQMQRGQTAYGQIMSNDPAQIKTMVAATNLNEHAQTIMVALITGRDHHGNALQADQLGIQLRKNNPAEYEQIRQAYVQIIVDLQWGLFKEAMVKKEGFSSGSITILDPQHTMINALERYVQFVNPQFDAAGFSFASITNGQAYNRSGNASSHWKGQVDTNRIYGIDVKVDGTYQQLLPHNKNHMQFAQLTGDRVFINWENYGTTLNLQDTSMINHGISYLSHHAGAKKGPSRSETKIAPEIQEEFTNRLKENNYTLTPAEQKEIAQQGIAGMRKMLKKIDNPQALSQFDAMLTRNYRYDAKTLDARKGNEVILSA